MCAQLMSYPLPVMLTADDFSDKDSSSDAQSSSASHTDLEDRSHIEVSVPSKPLPLLPRNNPERSRWAGQWSGDAQSASGSGKQYLSPVYEAIEDEATQSDRYGDLPCIYVP